MINSIEILLFKLIYLLVLLDKLLQSAAMFILFHT